MSAVLRLSPIPCLLPPSGTFPQACVSNLIVRLLSSLVMLFASSLLVQTSLPQSSAIAQFTEPEEDRSFYLDHPVLHPEALSGIWETPSGSGGAVGIHLQLAAKNWGRTTSDRPQTVRICEALLPKRHADSTNRRNVSRVQTL